MIQPISASTSANVGPGVPTTLLLSGHTEGWFILGGLFAAAGTSPSLPSASAESHSRPSHKEPACPAAPSPTHRHNEARLHADPPVDRTHTSA